MPELPINLHLCSRWPFRDHALYHEVLVFSAEHHRAPAAPDMFELIRDVRSCGHDVCKHAAKRQLLE